MELYRHQKELKVVDGLIKLLMDRTVFLSAQEIDYPALREKIQNVSYPSLRAGTQKTPFFDAGAFDPDNAPAGGSFPIARA